MSQELITRQEQQLPFGRAAGDNNLPGSVNAGAVAIEQERAIAEAQGKLAIAKRFPRDLNKAHAELMIACKSKAFAEQAFYSVPNRGSGPSIRFAEEVAQVVGNFKYGHRELSRDEGKSEVEVYAWDMEKNNESSRQITVLHIQDTRQGPKALRDQADIDNRIANVASKQMRGRILALLPKWLIAEAIEECKKTLTGTNSEPLSVRVRKMTQAFTQFGVTTGHLERYLGHGLDDVLIDELVDLQGVFNALREGAKASDYFGEAEKEEAASDQAASLAATAKAGAKTPRKAAPAKQQEAAAGKAAEKPGNEPEKTSSAAEEQSEPTPQDEPTTEQEAQPEAEQQVEPGAVDDIF